MVIYDDLAEARQFECSTQEFRIGHESDLDEHALEREAMNRIRAAIAIGEAGDGLAITLDLGRLRVEYDRDVV